MTRKHPMANCEQCPLRSHIFRYVPSMGPVDATHIVVGEAPGQEEVIRGKPFIGDSGQLLRKELKHAGIDPDRVLYTNAVGCRPPNNDLKPYAAAVEACRGRLEYQLSGVKSNAAVLAVGNTGVQATLQLTENERAPKKVAITKDRGRWHEPVDGAACNRRVLPTLHPAYVLRVPAAHEQFRHDVEKFASGRDSYHPLQEAPNYAVAHTPMLLRDLLDTVGNDDWVSFDVETDGLVWYERPGKPRNKMLCLGFGLPNGTAVIIPDSLLFGPYRNEVRDVINAFARRVRLTGHNAKFDELFCDAEGLRLPTAFDTILAHAIHKETPPHGLKEIATLWYGVPDYEQWLVKKHLRKASDSYELVPRADLYQYLAWDLAITWYLRNDLEAKLLETGQLQSPFYDVVMRAHHSFVKIEQRGMAVDIDAAKRVLRRLEAEYDELEHQLQTVVGTSTFNPRSYQQVGAYLFDKLGFTPSNSKHFAERSTATGALKEISGCMEHPFTKMLMHHRRVSKMLSSYVRPILMFADCQGRVHSSYKLFGAETGRISAMDPAIQTIPRGKRDRYGAMIRALFVARLRADSSISDVQAAITPYALPTVDALLVEADYSQAELRVWAHKTQDPFLLTVYREGRDLHAETALRAFGPNYTDEERSLCKNGNFAIAYGSSPLAFLSQHNLPRDTMLSVANEYKRTLAVAFAWQEAYVRNALRRGYAETVFGRRKHLPVVAEETLWKVTNETKNFPIQSEAADLNLLTGCIMNEEGYGVVLSMHDATYVECSSVAAARVEQRLHTVMKQLGEQWMPSVPWVVDTKAKDRWYPMPDGIMDGPVPDVDLTAVHRRKVALPVTKTGSPDPSMSRRKGIMAANGNKPRRELDQAVVTIDGKLEAYLRQVETTLGVVLPTSVRNNIAALAQAAGAEGADDDNHPDFDAYDDETPRKCYRCGAGPFPVDSTCPTCGARV